MAKYKLSWKDLTWNDFKIYLFALFKAFIPKKKIKNVDDLEEFIQAKSAWVTQVTLYGYLKTRMGTRYVLHFENDEFMSSVNIAKWNIYSVALQDLTLYSFSYLKAKFNYLEVNKAKEIFYKILDDETSNQMPLNIIEERTVGPDLGKDSIKAGIIALIIGFILVVLFILAKYKIFGIITNLTLIINLFLLIGILTIFEATLTLPGIAGIILTVGMAVDANVLIFERIKEEKKGEKNQLIAFDSGYEKSKTAVIDANITTLIAAIILFFMGSGPIKGFSVTLGVGIFTTLFSVYFIARLLTSLYVTKNKHKEKLI